jgi:hypothetical protein
MHKTHYQPSRSQHLMLVELFKNRYSLRSPGEKIVIHHVLKDSSTELYLQIERQCPDYGVRFERVWL